MTFTLTAVRDHVNATVVALTLLFVALFAAALWGSGPAALASVLGMRDALLCRVIG